MTSVECSACGQTLRGRGPGGLGVISHWNKHRREYFDEFDEHGTKDDIRDWLSDTGGFDGSTDVEDAQTRIGEFDFQRASQITR